MFSKNKLLLAAVLASSSLAAQAQNYDFTGNLLDVFEVASTGEHTFEQRAGRLIFHNSNAAAADTTAAYFLKNSAPTFDQSWSLSARVVVPLPVSGQPGSPNTEEYAEVGIACLFGDASMAIGLESRSAQDTPSRLVTAEIRQNDAELFEGQGDRATPAESMLLMMRYDANTRVMKAYMNGELVLDLDIAADGANNSPRVVDWGMTAASRFSIAIFASSENHRVPEEAPLQMDDFSFSIDGVNAPTSGALGITTKAMEIQATTVAERRYELQTTPDLARWFTIQTVFGTGGLQRIPVQAELPANYYRLR